MSDFRRWEFVTDHGEGFALSRRLAVPGGWLYQVQIEGFKWSQPVFVAARDTQGQLVETPPQKDAP